MATFFKRTANLYDFLIYELADKRTEKFFLVESPLQVFMIMFGYLYFCNRLGPRIMKNRKPFDLRNVMIVYNVIQIVINAFLFIEGYRLGWGWGKRYNKLCEPVNHSEDSLAVYVARLVHVYYMLKILDLLDTVFMVLRKKNEHVSFLHLYHHAGMVPIAWGATKYLPGGHGTFVGFVNSFVHTIMYSYYSLAILRPPNKYGQIWWKKYLTLLQLVQFVLFAIHQTLPMVVPNCKYPIIGVYVVTPQAFFFIYLFGKFYVNSYIHNSKAAAAAQTANQNGKIAQKTN